MKICHLKEVASFVVVLKYFVPGQAFLKEITVFQKPCDSFEILRNRVNGTVK